MKLFTERVPGPRDGATGAELQAIAGITATLDGLPLAIELAAARAARLGLEQLAAMLNDRGRAVTAAVADRPPAPADAGRHNRVEL